MPANAFLRAASPAALAIALTSLAAPACAAGAPPADGQNDPRPFGLGEIVVTAPKVTGVAVDSHTLSAEAIRVFDRTTLDDAANLIPGVNSANTGGSRNERTLYVRGFNRFEAPLSIDGIRVFLPADNRLDYGRFLTPDVAEVQVAKGYVSVLNGPDGMGGAVNLVTRKPSQPIEAEARAQLNLGHQGEYEGYDVFGLIGTRQDKWYAQGSFTRAFTDHWDLASGFKPTATEDGGERDKSRTADWRLNVKLGLTPNATDEYSISYTRQEGSKLAPLSTTDPLSIQKFWTWPYWNIDSLYFLSSTALNDRLTLKTQLYRNTFDNLLSAWDNANENTQTLGKAFNSYYADLAWGAAARLDWKASDADTLGLAFHYRRDQHVEWQQSFAPVAFTEPHQTSIEDTFSFAAENRYDLARNLTLTAGVGYDWRHLLRAEDYASNAFVEYPLKNGSAWSGQAALSWRPADDEELHLSVSSRTRFPTLFDRFSSRFGGAVSNPDLKPERATNVEVGGSKELGQVHLEGAVFYSHLNDIIVSVPFIYTSCVGSPPVCTPNAVTQSRNVGNGDYYGLEFAVSDRISPTLNVGGNFTFIHRDQHDPTNAAFRPVDVPDTKAFLYVDWTALPRVHVQPSLDLASNRWTVNSAGTLYYRTGAYAVGNVRLAYDVSEKVEVSVGVKNLFDDNYTLVDGFPEAGRSFFLAARARY